MLVRAADSDIDSSVKKYNGLGLGNAILAWRYSKSMGLRRRQISGNLTKLPGYPEVSTNVNRCLDVRVALKDARANLILCGQLDSSRRDNWTFYCAYSCFLCIRLICIIEFVVRMGLKVLCHRVNQSAKLERINVSPFIFILIIFFCPHGDMLSSCLDKKATNNCTRILL